MLTLMPHTPLSRAYEPAFYTECTVSPGGEGGRGAAKAEGCLLRWGRACLLGVGQADPIMHLHIAGATLLF